MTNRILISIVKENLCKELDVQNCCFEFSTIEELEEKLSKLPYSKEIKSILKLKRFRVKNFILEDFTKTFVVNTDNEFEAVRYHINCNLVIEEKRLSNEERLKIKLKREQQNNKVLEKAKERLYDILNTADRIEVKLKRKEFDAIFMNRRGGDCYCHNDESNFILIDKELSKFYVYTRCNGFTEIKNLKTTRRIFAQKPIDIKEFSDEDLKQLTKYVEKIYKMRAI